MRPVALRCRGHRRGPFRSARGLSIISRTFRLSQTVLELGCEAGCKCHGYSKPWEEPGAECGLSVAFTV